MGLNANSSRFLLYARRQGADFSRTATLGRQGMYLSLEALRQNLKDFGFNVPIEESKRLIAESSFAEPFLRLLGAAEIASFDASDYEKASHIHDFNLPLGEEFSNRFSVVFDGGTLEHIFNFPQAISNCMRMVRPGGHFIEVTPTNNFSGHGFYQFSPELLFRVLSPDNGFAVHSMLACEEGTLDWKAVEDPAVVGHRVLIDSQKKTSLLVIARKTATVTLFTNPVQQNDYALLWEKP